MRQDQTDTHKAIILIALTQWMSDVIEPRVSPNRIGRIHGSLSEPSRYSEDSRQKQSEPDKSRDPDRNRETWRKAAEFGGGKRRKKKEEEKWRRKAYDEGSPVGAAACSALLRIPSPTARLWHSSLGKAKGRTKRSRRKEPSCERIRASLARSLFIGDFQAC